MKVFPIAVLAAILAVTVSAVPMEKRATCKTDDDCPGVTCCNLSTNQCVNDPNDTICGIPPTKTTTTKTKTTKTTAGTGKPTSKPQCKTDDDCPGVTCCNLNNNQCVNDPNDNICGIPPTKTTTTKTKTTTTGKPTSTPQCKTDDDCPGVTCCNLNNNQCVNDPNDNICGIPPTKTTTTKTKTTTTGKPTSTPQCKTDDDCPGVTCCNLNNNQCVNDPNDNICGIPPTKTTTIGTKTTTTGKPTSTPQCKTDDDCPGVKCCNLNNNQCVNDPNDNICGIPPTKTTLTKTKTTGTGKPTSSPQCKTNDDCPGVTCCNLSTNKCVKDPNGTICDIPPK